MAGRERAGHEDAPVTSSDRVPGWSRGLLTVAALVIVMAGMRAAEPILVPFVVSLFFAIIAAPALIWLQGKGVPATLAVVLVVAGLLLCGTGIVVLLGTSLNDFSAALPGYQDRILQETSRLLDMLEARGLHLSRQQIMDVANPAAAMRLVASVLKGLGGVLTNSFLIFLTVILILLEASEFPEKLRAAFGDPKVYSARYALFAANLKRYFVIKTAGSLATGVAAAIWVWALGVDFALLWGLVAFLLNYVPNLGSIIAAVPPILLAFIQFGPARAVAMAAGYTVVNVVLGNFVEPRFLGRGLGLSTLVVFLSLVFWGWIWGPVGMLFSVPLTMTVKIALESSEETRWIAIFLGPEPVAEERPPMVKASKS